MTSATEPAVPYISSSVPFNLNVGVTPMRKLLEVMGRENPLHFAFSATIALKQFATANKKIKARDTILYRVKTTSMNFAEISPHLIYKAFSMTQATDIFLNRKGINRGKNLTIQ
jgi:hypothetical protein